MAGPLRPAAAFPVPAFSLRSLLAKAPVILEGDVTEVKAQGERKLIANGREYALPLMEANFKTAAVLKGPPGGDHVRIVFATNSPEAKYPGLFETLAPGDHCLVFLRKSALETYEFATPEHGKVIVAPRHAPLSPEQSVEARIEELLVGSLSSEDRSVVIGCIGLLPEVGGERAREALISLLGQAAAKDPPMRGRTLAALMSLGWPPAVEAAADFLRTPAWSPEHEFSKALVRRAFVNLHDPKFAPQLELLLAPDDPVLRRDCAMSLRTMRAESSIPFFVWALDDRDSEVRYQALMGLAETLGRYDGEWAASWEKFRQDEERYISLWKGWWRNEGLAEFGSPQY
jgi:hypothetical protein